MDSPSSSYLIVVREELIILDHIYDADVIQRLFSRLKLQYTFLVVSFYFYLSSEKLYVFNNLEFNARIINKSMQLLLKFLFLEILKTYSYFLAKLTFVYNIAGTLLRKCIIVWRILREVPSMDLVRETLTP